MKVIGIDIGGANTKLASSDGSIIELHYIPLWKDTRLPTALKEAADRLQPDKLGVAMTGELADCFFDKEEGIRFIMDAVENAFGCEIKYVNNEGEFNTSHDDIQNLAAANWAASANLIGSEVGDCVFVDVGSTTSDIIPVIDGKHRAGYTDFSRLLRSELVYAGTLRTNIATLLDSVKVSGGTCRLSSELFATTADAYLLLGDITQQIYTCETADGAGNMKNDAMRRIGRVVCADLTEIQLEDITRIAKQVKDKQVSLLCDAISDVAGKHGLNTIAAAGIGEFMIKDAAKRLGFELISVSEKWGSEISKVFPAYAAARMFERVDQ
ncbi:MAG TPA: H4MPT-linked C1 transfer pathway protein [Methanosarcinaceae archaeon]|nr:H4MPT-linked C1 transfer pathway protein [Methanosarcinaceae archaeon]